MLTPQEINDKRFEKAMFTGYAMADVDEFLERLTEDYTSLYKENAILKSKMKVLAETVEEHRSVADEMRKVLRGAQLEAEKTVKTAQDDAVKLIETAKSEAQNYGVRLTHEMQIENARLEKAKRDTVKFVNQMRAVYQEQIKSYQGQMARLSMIPELPVPEIARQEELTSRAEDIDASVLAAIQDTMAPAPEAREIDVSGGSGTISFPAINDDDNDPRPHDDFSTTDLGERFGNQATRFGEKKVKESA
ncbi:hypothetical protein FACS1894217_01290 [Clostridia bacterium]|nr:hypothetical protein FACS1894217_01290 [Clostridia bacterium]